MSELQTTPTETREETALLEQMAAAAKAQEANAKRQTILMGVAAAACVGIFVLVLSIYNQVQPLLSQLQPVLTQLSAASEDLSQVSRQLTEVDIKGTVEGFNQALISAQDSLATGGQKLQQLDVEGLNDAIENLTKVVEPLARLFG